MESAQNKIQEEEKKIFFSSNFPRFQELVFNNSKKVLSYETNKV